MALTIRRAESADYDALCYVLADADQLHGRNLRRIFRPTEGPARSREYVDGLLRNPQGLVLLAEADGEPAGCVIAQLRPSPPVPLLVPRQVAYVETLAVAPAWRRRGIGRALMGRVHAWAHENGAQDLELTVFEFNQEAIAFYRALGYDTLSRTMARRVDEA